MAVTAGALSKVLIGSSTANLSSAAATAGTGPYTYQWYRSTTTGFTPGSATLISGATSLTLDDTGITPSTSYFYKVVATDTGASSATSTSAQLAVNTTQGGPNPNQFKQQTLVGTVDQSFNYDTLAVQIDPSSAGGLKPGQAVKVTQTVNGVPMVIECAADTDDVFGFINYNFKNVSFNPYDRCDISTGGNVIYLVATTAIPRGKACTLDLTYIGGVAAATGSSSNRIVGTAYDIASAAGQTFRVKLSALPNGVID